MKSRKHMTFIFCASLFINGIFLWINYGNKEYCAGSLLTHAEIGYNFYKYNSIKINSERISYVYSLQKNSDILINYSDIEHDLFEAPSVYRNIYDTMGYGVLLGLIWKVTGSLRYIDIQLLQILIFSLLMFLVYQIGFLLFGSSNVAFAGSIAHLLFFPLIFQNIQVHRDIWAFYGLVVFLYVALKYLKENYSLFAFFCGCLVFSFIQFIRPLIYLVPFVVFVCMFLFFLQSEYLKKIIRMFLIFFCVNIGVFWIPFMAYNKISHDRYFLCPSGIGLVQGLGEEANPWGYVLDDAWYANFMKKTYGLISGTAECDDKARELFFIRFREKPFFFFKTILKRIPMLLLPNLLWSFYPEHLYGKDVSFIEKIKKACSSGMIFFDFITRLLYVRLFLMLGYIGLLFALFRKKYFEVILALGIACSSWTVIFSHVEYRYLIPFYSFFSFFVGYAFIMMKARIHSAAS